MKLITVDFILQFAILQIIDIITIFVFIQETCLAVPSKISSTATQCIWYPEIASCQVTEPPQTLIFIVIVALITTILTIPPVIILCFVLENFAASFPGKQGYRHQINGKSGDKIMSEVALKICEEENKSLFGEAISRAIKKGSARDSYTSADLTQITYSGLMSTIF